MMSKMQRVISGAVALSLVASIAIAQAPLQLRGTIESVAIPALVVKARDGTTMNVRLADDVRVFTLRPAALADVKPGGHVGLTASEQLGGDGNLGAVEIYILPDKPIRDPDAAVSQSVVGRENQVLRYIEGLVTSAQTRPW